MDKVSAKQKRAEKTEKLKANKIILAKEKAEKSKARIEKEKTRVAQKGKNRNIKTSNFIMGCKQYSHIFFSQTSLLSCTKLDKTLIAVQTIYSLTGYYQEQ